MCTDCVKWYLQMMILQYFELIYLSLKIEWENMNYQSKLANLVLYLTIIKRNRALLLMLVIYLNIYSVFKETLFDFLSMAEYLRYPSQELPFKDIIKSEVWQQDDVFVQQRLAGLNPMSLRKMSKNGKNQILSNMK